MKNLSIGEALQLPEGASPADLMSIQVACGLLQVGDLNLGVLQDIKITLIRPGWKPPPAPPQRRDMEVWLL